MERDKVVLLKNIDTYFREQSHLRDDIQTVKLTIEVFKD